MSNVDRMFKITRMTRKGSRMQMLLFNRNVIDELIKWYRLKPETVHQEPLGVEYRTVELHRNVIMEYRINTWTSLKHGKEAYLYEIKIDGETRYIAPQEPKKLQFMD